MFVPAGHDVSVALSSSALTPVDSEYSRTLSLFGFLDQPFDQRVRWQLLIYE